MTRILSGVKPTGSPHLGNLFGMILPAIELTNANPGALLFIPDIHALNSVKDATKMRELSYEVAATLIACGFDVSKNITYRQSDIPEIFELSAILMPFTPKGLMNRAHAYKDRLAKDGNDDNVDMGLYTYPVLMAADILAFDTDIVPVGLDQKQHIEIARDIAERVNAATGKPTLKLPKESIKKDVGTIPGLDGRKMSKSYGNTIEIYSTPEETAKKLAKLATDSLTPADPKPDDSAIYNLMRLANVDKQFQMHYLSGGIGYGDAKKELANALNTYLSPMREKYNELINNKAYLDKVLSEGATKARAIATPILDRVKKDLGLL
ncbi:MAG: tryptophan--tRNA ligase [Alphaproteobacteria bacterium]|nr:tryptophan--tRNA ligase [Alphaproteobacteria bacterium]